MTALDPVFVLPLTSGLSSSVAVGATVTATYTRSGAIWYLDPDDSIIKTAAANTPPYSSLGVLVEPPRTNHCTNHNSLSTDSTTNVSTTGGTLSTQTDVAALTAAGLVNICPSGRFFRLVNASGSQQTVTIAGASGHTNNVALSAYARTTGGTATMQITGGAGAVPVNERASFSRIVSEDITSAGTETMQFVVPTGVTLDWVLNQMEGHATEAYTGVGCTGPIVVAGASAGRNVIAFAFSFGENLDLTDSIIAADITPASARQWNGAAAIMDIQENSSNYWQIGGPCYTTRRVGGDTAVTSEGYAVFATHTYTIAARNSRDWGLRAYANGFTSTYRQGTKALTAGIQSASVRVGRNASSTYRFNGWIRNIRVYHERASHGLVQALTRNYAGGVTEIENMGPPVYDPTVPGRIWALEFVADVVVGNNPDRYKYLCRSDDWGDTWTRVYDLGAYRTLTGTLFLDRAGHAYYSYSSDLRRIDVAAQTNTQVIASFDNDGPNGAGGASLGKSWSFTTWSWGQDSDTLYCAAYMASSSGAGDRYWYSTDGGENWAIKNLGISGARHIHSLSVDPSTDRLWLCIGDDPGRTTGWTDDNLATALNDVSSPDAGETGLTFTAEATWMASDNSGASEQNYVNSSDGATTTRRYAVPSPQAYAPIYFAAAAGAGELWVSGYSEVEFEATQKPYIAQLVKDAGVASPWRVNQFIPIGHRRVDGLNPYAISTNGINRIIPDTAPYVYVLCRMDSPDRDVHLVAPKKYSSHTYQVVLRIARERPEFAAYNESDPLGRYRIEVEQDGVRPARRRRAS